MRRTLPILAAAALVLAAATPAPGATKRDRAVKRSVDLWATVNVCDTPARPNVLGVRASMPGSGRRETLSMRFRVQFRSDGRWTTVEEGADSGWERLGVSRRRTLESGYSFTFAAPENGGTALMRGVVTFRWRARGRTTRRLREVTRAGHRSTVGADPPNFSAATCELR